MKQRSPMRAWKAKNNQPGYEEEVRSKNRTSFYCVAVSTVSAARYLSQLWTLQ